MPSILISRYNNKQLLSSVLNLIIRGIPSIQLKEETRSVIMSCFKPYSTRLLKCSNWSHKQINQVY